jgi:ATP-dependent Clp protease protease subunit
MNLPYIWAPAQKHGSYLDLATYLLGHRTIFLGPELTTEMASVVAMQMLALSQQEGEISLYINCYGGSVPAGLAIIDMIDYANGMGCPVRTYCIGECVGVATAILASGRKGGRRAFPSARISIYQEWYGVESLWGAEMQDANERRRLMQTVKGIFQRRADTRELDPDSLERYFKELYFFNSDESIKLGIVDALCGRPDILPAAGADRAPSPVLGDDGQLTA